MPITDTETLRDILGDAKVIAVVGHSDKWHRTSYQIGRLLKQWGYTVYPVNPEIDEVDGDKVYATLADVPEKVDIVNVFRRSEYVAGVVEEAMALGTPVVWTQLGVVDHDAARRAEEAGLPVVMNKCIKVEYMRLMPGG